MTKKGNNLKRCTGLALAFAILFSVFSGSLSAMAAGSGASGIDQVSDKAAFLETINRHLLSRDASFCVNYSGRLGDVYTDFPTLMDQVCAAGSGSGNGDYLEFSMKNMAFSLDYVVGENQYPFQFTFEYLTTSEEERYIDLRVSEILEELQVYGASDYIKIRTVYDYICVHFLNDYSLKNYSVYDGLTTGKMVCQGYALLLYKMLTELGVSIRIVSGASRGEDHAWNIVRIGRYWYNLDVTWDSGYSAGGVLSHSYFLKGSENFPNHTRDSKYLTSGFVAQHPVSPADFSGVESVSLLSPPEGDDALLFPGDTCLLSVSLSPESRASTGVVWSSSDETVATVSAAGFVTAVSGGTVTVTATAADSGQASASVSFTVVDFSKSSSWAQGGLRLLYGRGIVPVSLLTSFGSGITRGEFVALLVNYYGYAGGLLPETASSDFIDIEGHPYQSQINTAFSLGIAKGKSSIVFAPDDPLTRQEGAKFLCSLLSCLEGEIDLSCPLPSYEDAGQISAWALPYVAASYERGLMQGTGRSFLPAFPLTREQAMLLVERLAETEEIRADESGAA